MSDLSPEEVENIESVTEPSEGQLSHVYDEATLGRSIEAILMVVDEPVTELTLASVLEVTVDQIVTRLSALQPPLKIGDLPSKRLTGDGASIAHLNLVQL